MKYSPKTRAFMLFSLSILSTALLLSYKKEDKKREEAEEARTAMQRSEAPPKGQKTVVDSTYSDWQTLGHHLEKRKDTVQ